MDNKLAKDKVNKAIQEANDRSNYFLYYCKSTKEFDTSSGVSPDNIVFFDTPAIKSESIARQIIKEYEPELRIIFNI